jgi:hypothetical protein
MLKGFWPMLMENFIVSTFILILRKQEVIGGNKQEYLGKPIIKPPDAKDPTGLRLKHDLYLGVHTCSPSYSGDGGRGLLELKRQH